MAMLRNTVYIANLSIIYCKFPLSHFSPSLNHMTSGGRLGRSGTTTILATSLHDSPSVPKVTPKVSSKVTSNLLG